MKCTIRVSITPGVSTAAIQGGQRADLATPTTSAHVVQDGLRSEPTPAAPEEKSHASTTPGDGMATTALTAGTVAIGTAALIPSISTPRVNLLQQILTASQQVRTAVPNLGVPQGLVRDVRAELMRLCECLRNLERSIEAKRIVPVTPDDRFHAHFGHHPSPRRPWDVAALGLFAEEQEQGRMSA